MDHRLEQLLVALVHGVIRAPVATLHEVSLLADGVWIRRNIPVLQMDRLRGVRPVGLINRLPACVLSQPREEFLLVVTLQRNLLALIHWNIPELLEGRIELPHRLHHHAVLAQCLDPLIQVPEILLNLIGL